MSSDPGSCTAVVGSAGRSGVAGAVGSNGGGSIGPSGSGRFGGFVGSGGSIGVVGSSGILGRAGSGGNVRPESSAECGFVDSMISPLLSIGARLAIRVRPFKIQRLGKARGFRQYSAENKCSEAQRRLTAGAGPRWMLMCAGGHYWCHRPITFAQAILLRSNASRLMPCSRISLAHSFAECRL